MKRGRAVGRFPRAAVFLLLAAQALPLRAWNDLAIFGDSLSDTGNLASITANFPWPYYRNRVSNGPLAVDVLAEGLGLSAEASLHLAGKIGGGNFAVDGANAGGSDAEDLPKQLQAYLDRHEEGIVEGALHVVMIGGNDLREARNRSDPAEADATVDRAVAAIRQALSTLLEKGAKNVLVANAPDIGRIPETLKKEQAEPGIAARATRVTRRFNDLLAQDVQALSSRYGVPIVEFDLFSWFSYLLANAGEQGFSNTTEGCFDPKRYSFHPDCAWGSGFDRFIFFDAIHPTGKTHRLMGEAIIAALAQTGKNPADLSSILLLLLD